MDQPKIFYRPEIDGLRAIAVISVLFYHAQIILFNRDWFEGGYIGVDIFFVISGYLITRIILSELRSKGSFSFLTFYERRARRILPMLFVVIFASMPFAWHKLQPSEMVEYAESIITSLFFSSNFFFYVSTTEYGADSALLKPFLHTWSLGVEEQFYLVFPVLAIIAFKFSRKHFLSILIALSLLSLMFAEMMEARNPDLNFYLPLSRFWELAVGSILAYRELNNNVTKESTLHKLFPVIGLCLISYGILFFDGKTPHPSLHTTIPILGVALIIAFASKDELIGTILGSKPFVWVGLISYSAYLWHFPIFAFARIDSTKTTNYDKLEWILLTAALSILSYFLIEQPCRGKKFVGIKALSASVACILISMFFVIRYEGFETRIDANQLLTNYQPDTNKLGQAAWNYMVEQNENISWENSSSVRVLIVGDSHSRDTFNMLHLNKELLNGLSFIRYGRHKSNTQISCFNETHSDYEPFRNEFYSSKLYRTTDVVLISNSWGMSTCLESRKDWVRSAELDGLEYLIKRIITDGKKVIVLGQSPLFNKIQKKYVVDHYASKPLTPPLSKKLKTKIELKEEVDRLLYSRLRLNVVRQKNKSLYEITRSFNIPMLTSKLSSICDFETEKCESLDHDGYRTLYDNSHLTLKGAEYLGEKMLTETPFLKIINEAYSKQSLH